MKKTTFWNTPEITRTVRDDENWNTPEITHTVRDDEKRITFILLKIDYGKQINIGRQPRNPENDGE
jgi:hypothetical protein